ncbi:M23 family metallopeptidase [Streptomyces sp. P9(2023)]|uniref:M23 family metallopeptidase n=1 Tax=Streptomyces sp. P9(2023) TaxID=3064394 RepID=UPI0028F3FD58|nr:M23 family metallopeptidase [Streptomyces sp. P9(2023)]MDT9690402.1 M23 family metallopeptidase [Streptomyces sp. P9(2023)]
MAFTRATGKHRGPSRLARRSAGIAGIAGVATLATTGVIGTLASPALAADTEAPSLEDTGLTQVVVADNALAETIDAQAAAQEREAAEAEAKRIAEARAKAEAKRKAEARAKEIREAKERAAREAERKRLNSFQLPAAGSHLTTAYKAGGSLWSSGSHSGADFQASYGTKVVSVGSGTVVEAGWGGAYGNNIVIRMNDGTYTQFAHLSAISVSVGQSVTPGQQIGISGSSGNSTGPHLHFEARTTAEYGSDIDPVAYLRARGVNV